MCALARQLIELARSAGPTNEYAESLRCGSEPARHTPRHIDERAQSP